MASNHDSRLEEPSASLIDRRPWYNSSKMIEDPGLALQTRYIISRHNYKIYLSRRGRKQRKRISFLDDIFLCENVRGLMSFQLERERLSRPYYVSTRRFGELGEKGDSERS